MTKSISFYFFVCEGRSNDDVGVATGTVFQELRPGAGFKTGDFVKAKLGGAIVERLLFLEQTIARAENLWASRGLAPLEPDQPLSEHLFGITSV